MSREEKWRRNIMCYLLSKDGCDIVYIMERKY